MTNILAIDTSCDDTAAAILAAESPISNDQFPNFKVLSNVVSSQVEIHQKYGGVYPTLAKREHQRNLPIVLKKALQGTEFLAKHGLGHIAVTVGPGLEPCLWTGINFAKDLAKKWGLPIVPVNHIEAHVLANFLPKVSEISKSQFPPKESLCDPTGQAISNEFPIFNFQNFFPAIALVVSGGHTQLILVKDIGKYQIIGETRDDAAGECFDKTARVLGLPYPGGPEIAKQATSFKFQVSGFKINLPRPMILSKDYDFSFSGLKTAVLYDFKKRTKQVRKSKEYVGTMSAEIQQAIIDVLIKKTIKATKDYRAKTIILGGGVSANKELRRQFQEQIDKKKLGFKFQVSSFKLCTDNAAMIAATAYFHRQDATKNFDKIEAKANLRLSEIRK